MQSRRRILVGGGVLILGGGVATCSTIRQLGSMDEYRAAVAAIRAALSTHPEIREVVRYACLAPSGHNTQSWKFRLGDATIGLLPDLSRRTPVVDPDDHHVYAGLGCAAENLALAAAAQGLPGEWRWEAGDKGGSLHYDYSAGVPRETELCAAIPRRQSSRSMYDGRAVSAADLRRLTDASRTNGVDLVVLTERGQMHQFEELVVAGNSAQMANAAFMGELKNWLRFSPHEALRKGDGLFSAASGSPVLPDWLGPRLLDLVFKVDTENAKYSQQIRTAAGVAVFVAQGEGPEHWVQAGRACQRFALQATALGIRCAFLNQAVEEASLRPQLASLIGLPGRRPDLALRFGYGPLLPYSARRPVDSVLV